MEQLRGLDELRRQGRMRWLGTEGAWSAAPEDVVQALLHDGFEECKSEEARNRRGEAPSGGMWQGLNRRTGCVASAIWMRPTQAAPPIVTIHIDGQPVRDVEAGA